MHRLTNDMAKSDIDILIETATRELENIEWNEKTKREKRIQKARLSNKLKNKQKPTYVQPIKLNLSDRPDSDVIWICDGCQTEMKKTKLLGDNNKHQFTIYCEPCDYYRKI